MATITDVAKAAGVSISTVSHVINGTRYVSDELRARVTSAMQAVSYRPSALARSLRVGKTRSIGLILPDNSNPFFAEVARHIEDIGYREGYSVILCNSDNNIEKQRSYVEVLIAKQADGVVLILARGGSHDVEELIRADVPVVLADREIPDRLTDTVVVDNERGGELAIEYLVGLGHRRVACIAGPQDLPPSFQRISGYKRALAAAGLPVDPAYISQGDFSFLSGEAAMRDLLSLPEPPSAVWACNDMMAIGAIWAARQAGLQVPQDLSVLGFDNIALSAAMLPALTTIAQPIDELTRQVMALLLDRMAKEPAASLPQRIVLTPTLLIRDSCQAYHEG